VKGESTETAFVNKSSKKKKCRQEGFRGDSAPEKEFRKKGKNLHLNGESFKNQAKPLAHLIIKLQLKAGPLETLKTPWE